MKKSFLLISASLLASSICFSAFGSDSLFELSNTSKKAEIFRASTSSNTLSIVASKTLHDGTISIVGPEGYFVTYPYSSQSITINLLEKSDVLPSGRYSYQVSAHFGPLKLIQDKIDNGREEQNFTYAGTPVTFSGSFEVKSGSIIQYAQIKEENANEW